MQDNSTIVGRERSHTFATIGWSGRETRPRGERDTTSGLPLGRTPTTGERSLNERSPQKKTNDGDPDFRPFCLYRLSLLYQLAVALILLVFPYHTACCSSTALLVRHAQNDETRHGLTSRTDSGLTQSLLHAFDPCVEGDVNSLAVCWISTVSKGCVKAASVA